MKDTRLGNSFRNAYDIGQLNSIERSGTLTAKDSKDIYRFSIGSRSRISFSLAKPSRGVNVQLFRSDRSEVPTYSALIFPPLPLSDILKPETYYFKVSGKGIKGNKNYSLTANAGKKSSEVFFSDRLSQPQSLGFVDHDLPVKSATQLFQ
jgi:hypothetical protein